MIKNINSVNILLMLFSFIGALKFPFELFLFSYIVLGPLHYMTELSWLKERNFFSYNSSFWRILFVLGLIIVTVIILIDLDSSLNWISFPQDVTIKLSYILISLILSSFVLSFFLTKKVSKLFLFLSGVVAFVIGLSLSHNFYFSLIVGAFIPTLVHTTIFTGAFILDGALKSSSKIGLLSFIVFMACNILFFIIPDIDGRVLDNRVVQNIFIEGDFFRIGQALNAVIYSINETFILDSPNGLRIQGFIAFAYTYHYLNWFSKTEVIKWHKIPKPQLILSVGIWLFSILLHLIDVRVGIIFITLLSMLHVIMEFPLNHRSFESIYSVLRAKLA